MLGGRFKLYKTIVLETGSYGPAKGLGSKCLLLGVLEIDLTVWNGGCVCDKETYGEKKKRKIAFINS